MKEKDINSLDHTTWRCQYHIVFAPKYRRMAIFGQIQSDIGKILRQLCQQKGVEIIEAYMCPDHVHMLLSIPPTVYVLSYIHLLLEGEVDPRILVGEKADALTQYIRSLDFGDTHDDSFFAKQELTGLYMDLIDERQLNVEATLSLVLEQQDTDGLTPIQRYYELEQTDEEFRKYWHSDFVMKLGKKADGYGVQQFVVLENIDDMLRFELVQTLTQGIGFKRCKNCGMLFVPSGRSDTLYCDFVAKGEEYSCRKIGANRQAKEKVAKDPVLQEHRRAYQRLNKRKEYGYMEEAEFKAWADEAALRRKQCQEGTITFDEYKAWLDETSLQKQ